MKSFLKAISFIFFLGLFNLNPCLAQEDTSSNSSNTVIHKNKIQKIWVFGNYKRDKTDNSFHSSPVLKLYHPFKSEFDLDSLEEFISFEEKGFLWSTQGKKPFFIENGKWRIINGNQLVLLWRKKIKYTFTILKLTENELELNRIRIEKTK